MVIAAVLGDAMSVSAMLASGRVAGHSSVAYHQPVVIQREMTLEAWVESIDGSRLEVGARIVDPTGRQYVEGSDVLISTPVDLATLGVKVGSKPNE